MKKIQNIITIIITTFLVLTDILTPINYSVGDFDINTQTPSLEDHLSETQQENLYENWDNLNWSDLWEEELMEDQNNDLTTDNLDFETHLLSEEETLLNEKPLDDSEDSNPLPDSLEWDQKSDLSDSEPFLDSDELYNTGSIVQEIDIKQESEWFDPEDSLNNEEDSDYNDEPLDDLSSSPISLQRSALRSPSLLGANPTTPQTFTLSFDSNGGEEVSSVELPAGTQLSAYRPEDPYYAHHMLLWWFNENGERFRWDDTTLDQDLHLTAHWAEFEDITYTGVYDEAIVSYTIMDRNVGATNIDIQDPSSEGYFFQWGNNYGLYSTPSRNIMTGTIVSSPQAPFYKEYFIKNENKWFQGNYPNLRWGAEDAPINSYDSANERLIRQGPCPYGYHVPSVEELYVFTMLYFHNHNLVDEPPLFNNIVGKKDGAKFGIPAEKLEEFAETFHFPFAGRIIGWGERDRYPGSARLNDRIQIILWSSTPVGDKAYIFEATLTGNKSYVNVGWWPNVPVIAMTMRCFQDEELLNVEWQNDDRTILEKDVDLDFGIMPEYNGDTPTKAPDRNYTYTFSWWNKEIGLLKRNMVFRATYTPHERVGYLITFSGTDLENTFVTEGETVQKPEDPTKIDSIFKGWYATPDYSQTFDFSSPILQDTIIYAKWEKKKYTITRKNADGTVLETDTNVPYGSNPQYNGQTPSKAKDQQYTYTFSGRTPTISEVTQNQTYTATFKTTTNQYSVTFKDENGTVLKSATQYPYGTLSGQIVQPSEPTKQGYTFIGWTPTLSTVTGNIIYTATYEKNGYTITYKVDGEIYATENHQFWDSISLRAKPTKQGYTFSGRSRSLPATMPAENLTIVWSFTPCPLCNPWTWATCSVSIVNNQCTYETSCKEWYENIHYNGTREPYCVPIEYRISYQVGSGTNHPENPTLYTIETPTFSLKNPERNGYLYKGRKEGNQTITQIEKGTKGNKNLTAIREPKKVHIILDNQGWTGVISEFWFKFDTQKYYTDEACSENHVLTQVSHPTKKGYLFQDYFSEEIGERFVSYEKDGTRIELNSPSEDTYYRISEEHTLKARRKEHKIHITLDKDGGTWGTDELWYLYEIPTFYADTNLQHQLSKIVRPTKVGYDFQDYFSEEKQERYLSYPDHSGNIIEFADDLHLDIDQNATLKARWTPKIIHVTLDQNGGTGGTSDFYFSFDTKKYYTDENLTQELRKIVKPTREGYTFQDYYSDEIGERFVAYQNGNQWIELNTPEEDSYYKISHDLTLKARRKENEKKESRLKLEVRNSCACFGSTYTKIGMIQRRSALPLLKDDMQICEEFHIFFTPIQKKFGEK